ncbi:hypothetical protein UPYG_G00239690, partial [Umbra pygmaea]
MAYLLGVFVLLSVWPRVKCAHSTVAVETECRDRYLLVTTNLLFAGNEPRFEAVDADGVYPITELYGSACGYMFSVLPLLGHAELRASYFSCHADNQGDEVFLFSFNFITSDEHGEEMTYAINETCVVSLPWSPREVSCEENYMEVSVKSDVSCPFTKMATGWTPASSAAHRVATSTWQVMFQDGDQALIPMSLSAARVLGYVFQLTQGRLVFRTPYRQPHSTVTMVNGTKVEGIHPILFSRQRWVVMMVDLNVACNTNDGVYDGAGLVWETPALLSPMLSGLSGLDSLQVGMGMDGQLLDASVVAGRGYSLAVSDITIQIRIPFNAVGGYRNSFVLNNTYYEVYFCHLYFEQILVDNGGVETRLRLHRPMSTPLLWQDSFVHNKTVVEERVFAVHLGNLTEDVDLVAVTLNGHHFSVFEANESHYNITMVPQPNSTLHGYVLRVPFEDVVVHKLHSAEGVFQYTLDVNFTLAILPQAAPFFLLASVSSNFLDVFPPEFIGVCKPGSIVFQMDHKPFDYLWEVTIGPYLLTENLASKRGYIMQNDSKSLILEVPVFTAGYNYEDIHLTAFFGTFEIISRDPRTLAVVRTQSKRCLFQSKELIVCSTKGVMTVVTNVTDVVPGAAPNRTSLADRTCRPKESDNTRALFSFGFDTCGTRVLVDYPFVVYENDIRIEKSDSEETPGKDSGLMVTLRCVYPLSGLHKLFAYRRFDADSPGSGTMLVTEVPVKSSLTITKPPITATTIAQTSFKTTRRPLAFSKIDRNINSDRNLPAIRPTAKYVRLFNWELGKLKEQTTYSPESPYKKGTTKAT